MDQGHLWLCSKRTKDSHKIDPKVDTDPYLDIALCVLYLWLISKLKNWKYCT